MIPLEIYRTRLSQARDLHPRESRAVIDYIRVIVDRFPARELFVI
jgi:hypothetical protein